MKRTADTSIQDDGKKAKTIENNYSSYAEGSDIYPNDLYSGYGGDPHGAIDPNASAYYSYGTYDESQMDPGAGMMLDPNCRTIYFGNVPQEATYEELLNQVRGGMLDSAKILNDKSCAFVSFVDAAGAAIFYQESAEKGIIIQDSKLSIGWGKPSPLYNNVAVAVAKGASRNVYIGNLNENELKQDVLKIFLEPFGEIDNIKMVADKKIAFIHFTSILNAVKAVESLPKEEDWGEKRIYYGKDRCDKPFNGQKSNNSVATDGFLAEAAYLEHSSSNLNNPNNNNRQIWIGNIHPEATPQDVCNSVRGGMLISLKMMQEKHCCFVTFIDAAHAANFYQFGNSQGLVIKGKRAKVNFGKPTPLNDKIIEALKNGATRNVYIGAIDNNTHNEDKLRHDFELYGEIEQIHIIVDKNTAFVNFMSIVDAYRACEAIKNSPDYSECTIRFGKDRCSNPFKYNPNAGNYAHQSFTQDFYDGTGYQQASAEQYM